MLSYWLHLCSTTAMPQASVPTIGATMSACEHWKKHPDYDAFERY